MQQLGQLDEAEARLHSAIALKPDNDEAHNNLGNLLKQQNRPAEAFEQFRNAIAHNPKNELFWHNLASVTEFLSFKSADESLMRDLLILLDLPYLRPITIQLAILSAIRHHQNFSQLLENTTGPHTTQNSIEYSDVAQQLTAIPLFLRLMSLCSIGDRLRANFGIAQTLLTSIAHIGQRNHRQQVK